MEQPIINKECHEIFEDVDGTFCCLVKVYSAVVDGYKLEWVNDLCYLIRNAEPGWPLKEMGNVEYAAIKMEWNEELQTNEWVFESSTIPRLKSLNDFYLEWGRISLCEGDGCFYEFGSVTNLVPEEPEAVVSEDNNV